MTEPPAAASPGDPTSSPALSVVRGHPTDEEVVALVVALSTLRTAGDPAPTSTGSAWSAYWRAVRAPLRPGPGAWRASARTD